MFNSFSCEVISTKVNKHYLWVKYANTDSSIRNTLNLETCKLFECTGSQHVTHLTLTKFQGMVEYLV